MNYKEIRSQDFPGKFGKFFKKCFFFVSNQQQLHHCFYDHVSPIMHSFFIQDISQFLKNCSNQKSLIFQTISNLGSMCKTVGNENINARNVTKTQLYRCQKQLLVYSTILQKLLIYLKAKRITIISKCSRHMSIELFGTEY